VGAWLVYGYPAVWGLVKDCTERERDRGEREGERERESYCEEKRLLDVK
jgi:hypothetical protein